MEIFNFLVDASFNFELSAWRKKRAQMLPDYRQLRMELGQKRALSPKCQLNHFLFMRNYI
jgi:hypothetical protein